MGRRRFGPLGVTPTSALGPVGDPTGQLFHPLACGPGAVDQPAHAGRLELWRRDAGHARREQLPTGRTVGAVEVGGDLVGSQEPLAGDGEESVPAKRPLEGPTVRADAGHEKWGAVAAGATPATSRRGR